MSRSQRVICFILLLGSSVVCADWKGKDKLEFKKDCFRTINYSKMFKGIEKQEVMDAKNNVYSPQNKICKCLLKEFQSKYAKYDKVKVWKQPDKDPKLNACIKIN